MPIFEYEPDDEKCEFCGGVFEVFQKMDDPPLEKCPTCEKPCHRTFSAFAVGGKEKSLLSKGNLEAHGFTRFERKGKGYYEKTAGQGPGAIVDGTSS